MAKPDLGTKRVCPETGRKFYDLNKDPIVSPYTGQSYQRSYFESTSPSVAPDDEVDEKEVDVEEVGAELISLEEADDEAKGDDDLALEDDVDLGDDDEDDTFLAEEEEDEDDVSGIVNVDGDDDEG